MTEYLAWINIGGGSSWSRGPNKDNTIQTAVSLLRDWERLYDVHDKEVTVNVIEVTGYDALVWDHEGVHGVPDGAQDDKYLKIDRTIEQVKRRTKPKPYAKKRKGSGYSDNSLRAFR